MKRFTNTDLSKSITHGDRLLIVIDDRVHDVSGWVNSHPGGSSLLRRYRGRDASDVFHAFHGPEVTKKLRAFDVGGVGDGVGDGDGDRLGDGNPPPPQSTPSSQPATRRARDRRGVRHHVLRRDADTARRVVSVLRGGFVVVREWGATAFFYRWRWFRWRKNCANAIADDSGDRPLRN
mmetsp:Transcript_2385/g.9217  ORF Transcript_2385/g.9217 Transcript_2385/m.9217 type:complete len:178 (+) Transcript_2385:232-765(+)